MVRVREQGSWEGILISMDLGIGVFSIEGMDAFIGNEVGKMRDKIQRGLDLSVQLFAVVCHVVQPQPWTGEVTRTVFFFLGGSWRSLLCGSISRGPI